MNKFYSILVSLSFLIIISSCESSKKYMQRGQYDAAVGVAVRKLQKSPGKEKEILVLEKAFPLANKKELDRIDYLNVEGQPNRWDEIFSLYNTLKNRQEYVKTVLPMHLKDRVVTFPIVNYDNEIVQAKNKAADYYVGHGKQVMANNNKQSFRDAYYDFVRAKEFNPAYANIDKMIDDCRNKGTSFALITATNNTMFKLPNEFFINLLNQDLASLSTDWTVFHSKSAMKMYDYTVNINIKMINMSPEKFLRNTRTDSKKVQDGYEYALDANGNVRKDTLGNDIKQPKYKTIYCDVIENLQQKICHIEGNIEYQENSSKQIVRTLPIAADNIFEFRTYTANGDLNALSKETYDQLGRQPAPFPPDIEMINAAGATLKNVIYQVLYDNRRFLN